MISWGWLFIDALLVDADARGQGGCLTDRAERHAVAQGCDAAWLDTFQAKAFYEARGYTIFGALQAYPAGQTQYFLRKCLEAPILRPDTDQGDPGWSTAFRRADQDGVPDPA